jgi:hypothetical protein
MDAQSSRNYLAAHRHPALHTRAYGNLADAYAGSGYSHPDLQ